MDNLVTPPEVLQLSPEQAIMTYLSNSDFVSAGTLFQQCYAYWMAQGNTGQANTDMMNALWCLRHAVCQIGLATDQEAMIAHAGQCVELARMIQTVDVPSESAA